MSSSEQLTKVNAQTKAEQIRDMLGLSGIEFFRRWQEMQRLAHNVCKEFFVPELQWRDISHEDVAKARQAMEDRDALLQNRPDIAHWFISKYQRSASYAHRQRLERSSAIAPFISQQSYSDQPLAEVEDGKAQNTDAKKRFDAVRNEWV